MRTCDYMEVSSVQFWRTNGLWCNNEILWKGMILPEKCVYIFTCSCCKCASKWEEVCWWSCSCLYFHSNFAMLLLKTSYPAENDLFPLKNICKHKAVSPQTVEKNKSVLHISRIFSFIAQISFSSSKYNSCVCPFPHQLAYGPVCSICSAKPPTAWLALPP